MRLLILFLSVIFITGCAGSRLVNYYPDALMDAQVDAVIDDNELVGKRVVLGGVVSDLQNDGMYTRVEVVRHLLSQQGYPIINQTYENNRLVFILPKKINFRQHQIGDLFSSVGLIQEVERTKVAGQVMKVLMVRSDKYQFWQRFDSRVNYYDDRYGFNSIGVGYYPHRAGVGFGFGRYF